MFSAVKLKEAAKGNNDTFLKRVEEYLKSDTYMYASLVGPPDQSEGNSTLPTLSLSFSLISHLELIWVDLLSFTSHARLSSRGLHNWLSS